MKYRLTGREDATEWMWKLVGGENQTLTNSQKYGIMQVLGDKGYEV